MYSAYSVGKTGLMRITEALAAGARGHRRAGLRPRARRRGDRDDPRRCRCTRAAPTGPPPEDVVELVAAIAAGELDQWSGRFLRAGVDDLDALRRTRPRAPAGSCG